MAILNKDIGFQTRIRSRAEALRKLPLQHAQIKDLIHFINTSKSKNSVLYVHIPFCKKKCSFCVYAKNDYNEDMIKSYFQVLERQIIEHAKLINFSKSISAVYFGGGSPSSVPISYIEKTLNIINKHYTLQTNCEITLECSVCDISDDYLYHLSKSQFNRISFGVQTFDTEIRKSIGRITAKETVIERITKVRNHFDNVFIDLIYNLENQTKRIIQDDLEQMKKLDLSGCSIYPLIDFSKKKDSTSNNDSENHENEFSLYKIIDDYLDSELNWKRLTAHQYNSKTIGSSSYVYSVSSGANIHAFGCGSGGKYGPFRYFTVNDIEKYIETANISVFEAAKTFKISENFTIFDTLLELPEILSINKDYVKQLPQNIIKCIDKLISIDLVSPKRNAYHLTQKGRFWTANIASFLIESIFLHNQSQNPSQHE
ncbi:MAG: radical SAM protein [Bacteroidales bacterium]|nr:radical SAM protein [Bacteroidales bacterium]